MKCIIDLTGNNFDIVDFTEASIIDFYCQQELPKEIEFSIWGGTLLLSPMWNYKQFNDFLPKTEDMYVSGLGMILRCKKLPQEEQTMWLRELEERADLPN